MSEQIITLWNKTSSTMVADPNHFTLRADRKHVWLQKIALWILAKLDARTEIPQIDVRRIRIDAADFVERLTKSRSAVLDVCGRAPDLLLMGPDDFEEIIGSPHVILHPVQFYAPVHGGAGGRHTLMNMRVCIVPWMRGMLPLFKRDLV